MLLMQQKGSTQQRYMRLGNKKTCKGLSVTALAKTIDTDNLACNATGPGNSLRIEPSPEAWLAQNAIWQYRYSLSTELNPKRHLAIQIFIEISPSGELARRQDDAEIDYSTGAPVGELHSVVKN